MIIINIVNGRVKPLICHLPVNMLNSKHDNVLPQEVLVTHVQSGTIHTSLILTRRHGFLLALPSHYSKVISNDEGPYLTSLETLHFIGLTIGISVNPKFRGKFLITFRVTILFDSLE